MYGIQTAQNINLSSFPALRQQVGGFNGYPTSINSLLQPPMGQVLANGRTRTSPQGMRANRMMGMMLGRPQNVNQRARGPLQPVNRSFGTPGPATEVLGQSGNVLGLSQLWR